MIAISALATISFCTVPILATPDVFGQLAEPSPSSWWEPESSTNTWIDVYAAPSTTAWALPPMFTDMSPFQVTSFAAGATNLAILRGSPAEPAPIVNEDILQQNFESQTGNWNDSVNCLQILYPKGSNAPSNRPQGGTEFYARPLDLSLASNVTLQYSVFFSGDFDFVKGGKLPGLFGGHKGCSGGNSAIE